MIKKFLIVVIIQFFAILLFSQIPTVKVNIYAPEYFEIFYANSYSAITETGKFKIYLKDEIKKLFEELRLQDLLSYKNIILKETDLQAFELNINVRRFKITEIEIKKEFLENNASGSYIYKNNNYLRVMSKQWYEYDYNNDRYIPSKDGIYVKAEDGNYYIPETFYTKFPHIESYYVVDIIVETSGLISNSFTIQKKIPKVWYVWNEAVSKPITEENSFTYVLEAIALEIKDNIFKTMKGSYKILGEIQNIKDKRVIINIGTEHGVLPDMVFDVDNKGQIIIRNVEKYFSEAEIYYLEKGKQLEIGDKLFEANKKFFNPFTIGVYYTNDGFLFSIGLKQRDIYGEKKAFLTFDYNVDNENLVATIGIRLLELSNLKVYSLLTSNYSLGINLNYKFFDAFFKYSLVDELYIVGSGFSW